MGIILVTASTISRRENILEQSKLFSKGTPSHLVTAVQLLRSLQLEIAVPRKLLKLFTSGGSGAAVEISEIRDSIPGKPSTLQMSKEG